MKHNYKIMQRCNNELINETDYYDVDRDIAIADYCYENECTIDDLLVQEFDD